MFGRGGGRSDGKVCDFFLQGRCKFGDGCKFEHPSNQSSNRFSALSGQNNATTRPRQGDSKDTPAPYGITKDAIIADLKNERPIWPFSAYAPGKDAPKQLLEGFPVEQSPEEMRLLYYLAQAAGNPQPAIQNEQELIQRVNQQIEKILSNPDEAINYIVNGENERPNRRDLIKAPNQPGQTQSANPFRSGGTSAFGQPSAFGATAAPQSQFGQLPFGKPTQPSSAFGQPSQPGSTSAFGQPSQPGATSAFGQPSQIRNKSAFGQPSQPGNTTSFGQASQPQAATAFGQPSQPGAASPFGQPSQPGATSAFGQPSQAGTPSAFGQPTLSGQSPFAQPSQVGSSAFGQPSNVGSGGAFGQASGLGNKPSPFGQPSQPSQPSSFGQPNQPNTSSSFAVAAQQPSTGSAFGQSSQPSQSPFASAANQSRSSPFAQNSQAGNSATPFGQASQPTSSPFAQANTSAVKSAITPVQPNLPPGTAGDTATPPLNAYAQHQGNQLRSWHNKPVTYIDSQPYYPKTGNIRNESSLERIWHPDGPPPVNEHTADSEDLYTRFGSPAESQFRVCAEQGRFATGIPLLAPKREWVRYDV